MENTGIFPYRKINKNKVFVQVKNRKKPPFILFHNGKYLCIKSKNVFIIFGINILSPML